MISVMNFSLPFVFSTKNLNLEIILLIFFQINFLFILVLQMSKSTWKNLEEVTFKVSSNPFSTIVVSDASIKNQVTTSISHIHSFDKPVIKTLHRTINITTAEANLVVATTHWNGTCDMLTSAKLSVGYLVVGITRELDKEPSLHYSSIYINTRWSMLQQCVYLMSYYSSTMLLPQGHHAISMCPDVILFNLCHHVCTICTLWETIVPWCHP